MNAEISISNFAPVSLESAEFRMTTYYHTLEMGQPFESVLRPEYWTHVAQILRPGHEIRIDAADYSFCALLKVRSTSRVSATVAVVWFKDFGDHVDAEADDVAGFEVKWRGPKAKFGFVRSSDGEVIRDGYDTREIAAGALREYLKAL